MAEAWLEVVITEEVDVTVRYVRGYGMEIRRLQMVRLEVVMRDQAAWRNMVWAQNMMVM